jgi:hypothetical protein
MCHCSPRSNIGPAVAPYADRLAFVGDAAISRLYKDGIGVAYRTAKAAAVTALFEGIGAVDFERNYAPVLRDIRRDNSLGKVVMAMTHRVQHRAFARRGLLRAVNSEQRLVGEKRRLSRVLWDTFTGSAPYREIFKQAMHPAMGARMMRAMAGSLVSGRSAAVRMGDS